MLTEYACVRFDNKLYITMAYEAFLLEHLMLIIIVPVYVYVNRMKLEIFCHDCRKNKTKVLVVRQYSVFHNSTEYYDMAYCLYKLLTTVVCIRAIYTASGRPQTLVN